MRYIFLSLLLAIAALGSALLENFYTESGTLLSLVQEKGVAPYLIAAPLIGALVLWTAPGSVGRFARLYAMRPTLAVRGFMVTFALGLAIPLALSIVLALAGQAGWGPNAQLGRMNVLLHSTVAAFLLACVVAIPEEMLFRGFLVSYLRSNSSPTATMAAILFSALIFALAHNLRDPFAWFAPGEIPLLVGLFLLGVLLAITYLATRSLWGPIGLHVALVMFDLAILQGGVLRIDLSPWWLGGGNDIREAPALWAAFCIASIAIIGARQRLQNRLAIEPFVGILTLPSSPSATAVGPLAHNRLS